MSPDVHPPDAPDVGRTDVGRPFMGRLTSSIARLTPFPGLLTLRSGPGVLTTAAILLVFLGLSVSVDYPRTALGFKGDEATYYSLAHSLARDGDFTFQRHDLTRVWEEFPGPEGIFLKRGRDIQGVELTSTPPFLRLRSVEDPSRYRLYYAKSFIYPLFAAPFVKVFGTNGFLVFHTLLLALNFAAAYTFLCARGSARPHAAAFVVVFLFATVVPIYFVTLTPELFNFTLVMLAFFLWTFKRALGKSSTIIAEPSSRLQRFLRSPSTDYVAAVLLGIATFSKPTHILLIFPLLALAAWRREWKRLFGIGLLFGVVVAGLFGANAAITGEFNYQGGNRKSFYGTTGFPFANTWETFDNRGQGVSTEEVPTDVLLHGDTLEVLGWNVMYFAIGRYSGFLPYFFPGVVALALFLVRRSERRLWQWLTLGAALVGAIALLLYMPYTYSGGGGPVGNRYFFSFYPLFLFLLPGIRSVRPVLIALGVGALFTAKLAINPFYSAFNPGEPAKAGPLRLLPIELTLLNDLPVSADAKRARLRVTPEPSLFAYFPDDGAYEPEEEWFWVRGGERADVILRAPAPNGKPLRIRRLTVQIVNGGVPNRVRVSGGFFSGETLELKPDEARTVVIRPGGGVPFKPWVHPTNYVYTISISTTAGAAPFLETNGENLDPRYLGARVRLVPYYEGR